MLTLTALITTCLLLLLSRVLLKTKMNTSPSIPFTCSFTDVHMPYIITQKTRKRPNRPEGGQCYGDRQESDTDGGFSRRSSCFQKTRQGSQTCQQQPGSPTIFGTPVAFKAEEQPVAALLQKAVGRQQRRSRLQRGVRLCCVCCGLQLQGPGRRSGGSCEAISRQNDQLGGVAGRG